MKTPARKPAAQKQPAAAKKPVVAQQPAAAKPRAARKPAAAKPPAGLDQSALQSLAGYSLRRAEVLRRQHFTRTLADWDIRGAEYSVLVLTAGNREVTQADLGEALNIKRPNMVSLIERLERRGLIVRQVHERDRRNHILSLTEKGEVLLADIEGPVREMDQRVTACWTAKERALVVALLRRFYVGNGA
jgi:DNA-binding MarR family transcriptional regulator